MINSFLVIIFFSWHYSAKKKNLLTNKRIYSSNGNTIILMILRFYATPYNSFCVVKKSKNGHNFSLRAPRRLLRSFLEVVFFWYFRGWNSFFVFLCVKKSKNGHNFSLRAPRRLLRSFLEVAFFSSFRGWNSIFCICFKNLKKSMGVAQKKNWNWIFIISSRNFFWDIEKIVASSFF